MRSSRALAGLVLTVVLVACTSSVTAPVATSPERSSPPGTLPTRSAFPTATATATATRDAVAAVGRLRCGDFIDGTARPAGWSTLLGVVALPTSPTAPAAQTALSGDPNRALRLFVKTGLVIRAGSTVELVAAAGAGIGWGNSAVAHHRFLAGPCPNSAHTGWLSYPGGFWLNHPACVDLTVHAAGRTQRARMGLGTACPGQRPPQGPNQR